MTQVFLTSKSATKLNGSYNSRLQFRLENINFEPYDDVYCTLINAIIPISSYLINENNNKIVVRNEYGVETTYTIRTGNYNINELIDRIKLDAPIFINIVFDTIKNKFTLTSANLYDILSKSTILNVLGFSNKDHFPTISKTHTSDYVCDLSGNNMFYLQIDEINTNNVLIDKKNSVMASMPIDVNYGDLFTYTNTSIKSRIYESSLTILTVNLLDEEFNLVNLNDKDWNFTLYFESYFNQQKFNNHIFLSNYLNGKE